MKYYSIERSDASGRVILFIIFRRAGKTCKRGAEYPVLYTAVWGCNI